MNILLLGSGGREHALAWQLAQSPNLTQLYATPGNPGIAEEAELVALDATDHTAVIAFCQAHAIDLVVIGPEAPLVDGLSDALRAAGVPVFGPSQAAAQLEGERAGEVEGERAGGVGEQGQEEREGHAMVPMAPLSFMHSDSVSAGYNGLTGKAREACALSPRHAHWR